MLTTSAIALGKLITMAVVLTLFIYKYYQKNRGDMAKMMKRYYLFACIGLLSLMVNPCAELIKKEDYQLNDTLQKLAVLELSDTVGFGALMVSMVLFFLFLIKCTIERNDTTRIQFKYLAILRVVFVSICAVCICVQALISTAEQAVREIDNCASLAKRIAHWVLQATLFISATLLLFVIRKEGELKVVYNEFYWQLWANCAFTLADLAFYTYWKFIVLQQFAVRLLDFLACGPILFNTLFMSTYNPDLAQDAGLMRHQTLEPIPVYQAPS